MATEMAQSRVRLHTVVGKTDFLVTEDAGVNARNLAVSVPISAKLQAAWSLATGKALSLGDSPLADVKDQGVQTNANIGLLAALMLTIVLPITMDASKSEQTNAYMITEPPALGQVTFVLLWMSSVSLLLATLGSVVAIIGFAQMNSRDEARYMSRIASSELLMPLKQLVIGMGAFLLATVCWMAIVMFGLDVIGDCGEVDENGTAVDPVACGDQTAVFVVCIVTSSLFFTWSSLVLVNAVAKMHKCKCVDSRHLRARTPCRTHHPMPRPLQGACRGRLPPPTLALLAPPTPSRPPPAEWPQVQVWAGGEGLHVVVRASPWRQAAVADAVPVHRRTEGQR
jgi:hypothetical protein